MLFVEAQCEVFFWVSPWGRCLLHISRGLLSGFGAFMIQFGLDESITKRRVDRVGR